MGIVRWGIAGSGAISEDFALGVLASSKASLQAVAARSKKRAEELARAHGAKQAYEGYDALAKDPEVDVVYVGVTNQEHKRVSELFLRRGKGVLCEKPATTSRSDTNELINISQRNSAFFMEGVWTRFFPVYSKLRALIANNELGRVTYFSAAFAPGNELHEESSDEVLSSKRRLWDPKYHGGILLGALCNQENDNRHLDQRRCIQLN
jgi:dihydrodiol dehydrogenase / D-xylose 1-dehydrogenase (NADP)